MLYPDGAADQKFWGSQARNPFMAFSLYLFEKWEDDGRHGLPESIRTARTLGQIYQLSSGNGADLA